MDADGASSEGNEARAAKRCEACGRSFAEDELFCPVDGAPLVGRGTLPSGTDPYLGLVLLGQIEIRKLAGAGSMARVYRAYQRGVDRDVAVKILHRELSADPEVVRRFHQEAKVASRLSNPHLVNVLLTAELPIVAGATCGELVLVTEFLDGLSLLSALGAAGGALPLPRALHIVLQMCEALAEAHRQGVVHRDVKPENVMLVQRGEDRDFVKILDFGLARLANKDASFATRQGAIFGSPKYISPEGAQGLPVGPAADVYAVATVLYEMLAGRTPFSADTPVGFLLAHTSEQPPRVSTHERASYVPAPLVDLLAKNLQKDPKDRACDASALAEELRVAAAAAGFSVKGLQRHDAWLGAPGEAAHALASVQRTKSLTLSEAARDAIRASSPEIAGDIASVDTFLDGESGAPKGHTMLAGEDDLPAAPHPVVPTLFDAPSEVALGASGGGISRPGERSSAAPQRTRLLEDATAPSTVPDVPALEPPPSRASRPAGSPTGATAILDPSISPSRPPPPVHAGSTPLPGPPLSGALAITPIAIAALAAHATPLHHTAPPTGETKIPVVSTVTEEEEASGRHRAPAQPVRTALFVGLCFVLGGGAAMAGASRLGAFRDGEAARSAQVDRGRADALLSALGAAEGREEWEGRPGSVRELFQQAEREHPTDPRFGQLARGMAARLLDRAIAARQRGDAPVCSRFARLATDLDKDNIVARDLLRDLGNDPTKDLPPPVPIISTPPPPRPPPRPTGTASPAASTKDTARWL